MEAGTPSDPRTWRRGKMQRLHADPAGTLWPDPWRGVPKMPVEIMHLPRWFPFHLDKVSYWSRTVIVPLLVLMSKQPKARNPKHDRCARTLPGAAGTGDQLVQYGPEGSLGGLLPRRRSHPAAGRRASSRRASRQKAVDKAVAWTTERLNGEDGLGAIYPAMANSVDDVRSPGLRARTIRIMRSPGGRSRS